MPGRETAPGQIRPAHRTAGYPGKMRCLGNSAQHTPHGQVPKRSAAPGQVRPARAGPPPCSPPPPCCRTPAAAPPPNGRGWRGTWSRTRPSRRASRRRGGALGPGCVRGRSPSPRGRGRRRVRRRRASRAVGGCRRDGRGRRSGCRRGRRGPRHGLPPGCPAPGRAGSGTPAPVRRTGGGRSRPGRPGPCRPPSTAPASVSCRPCPCRGGPRRSAGRGRGRRWTCRSRRGR